MGRKPKGDRAMTAAERQKVFRIRRDEIKEQREKTLARIVEISTDPVVKKLAEMALKGDGT